jgi:hypothetical protein
LESKVYFEELSTVPTAEEIKQWDAEISEAEKKRTTEPEAMDVMAPRIPKGSYHSSTRFIRLTSASSTNIG